MADSVRRRSSGGVLPLGRHTSISGSSLVQCASVSIAPPPLSRGAKRPQPHPVQARTGPRSRGRGATPSSALANASGRLKVALPGINRHHNGRIGLWSPQLLTREGDRVEPLWTLATTVRVGVRGHEHAPDRLDDALLAARTPG